MNNRSTFTILLPIIYTFLYLSDSLLLLTIYHILYFYTSIPYNVPDPILFPIIYLILYFSYNSPDPILLPIIYKFLYFSLFNMVWP